MQRAAMTRRLFVAAAPLVATPALAAPEQLTFAIYRKGSDIGRHVVEFARRGEDLDVRVTVDIAVKLGPITLYRYSLRAEENWQRGVLMAARGDTMDGGKQKWMRAARQNGRFMVDGSKSGKYVAPEASLTSSHWNPAEMAAPMVDLQDGELLDFTVVPRGATTVQARGRQITATHYALSGPAKLDLYYDEANTWSALQAVTNEDSSVIEYRQL